ncbi:MAG: diaminopropionate ammonia-lyase [Rhodospirillaceae bacterium]|nr:diaminopropionate ammonia-lyase [Rhodospirillaceae bacterium]
MQYTNTPKSPAEPRLFRPSSDRPMAMLKICPAYAPTPLIGLQSLAGECGVGTLSLKDESQRMRLGSFKALGGAFAVAQMISDRSGEADPTSDAAKAVARDLTFITASAGNHGLSIAAGARVFGANGVIVLSASVPEGFAARIRAMGAEVVRVDGNYEDSVAEAMSLADANDWLLLADGSWDGYIERPALVMEGYTVLAEECRSEFVASGNWPTHVFLQAGVGGFAAAVAAQIRVHWAEQPEIIIVEPDDAPCLIESVKAGRMTHVDGPLSNMGRLDCKDASLIAYSSLKDDADLFITISDDEGAAAADTLAAHNFKTTPSGAASLAGLKKIAPGADSRCLVFMTEGLEEG